MRHLNSEHLYSIKQVKLRKVRWSADMAIDWESESLEFFELIC